MPDHSTEFNHLQERITLLSAKFVDDQIISETTNPSEFIPDVERLAAFRLLVHAEIEDYIEKKARNWLNVLKNHIGNKSYNVKSVIDLYVVAMFLESPLSFKIPFDINMFTDELQQILNHANKVIDGNNGIKLESFLKLSILCGKHIDEIDYAIATLLSEYGRKRGDVAHKSTSRVTNIQAPSAELSTAKNILSALKNYFCE